MLIMVGGKVWPPCRSLWKAWEAKRQTAKASQTALRKLAVTTTHSRTMLLFIIETFDVFEVLVDGGRSQRGKARGGKKSL